MKIKLGKTYKDLITNYQGVATGLAKYISGCRQVLLSTPVDLSGRWFEPMWFDEQRLEEIDLPQIHLENGSNPGCDKQAPKR